MAASDASVGIRFTHDGRTVDLPAERVGARTSPFTAKELRELRSEVTLREDEAATLRQLVESPITDASGVEWEGRLVRDSYVDGGPHTLVIEWTERESVLAESVEFEGLSLTPADHYVETEEDGAIAITFRASLSEDEMRALWALREGRSDTDARYWPVVRRGVTDEPRTVRLGQILWQNEGNGRYAHLITLVEEAMDQQEHAPFIGAGEPELAHAVAGVIDLAGQFEALLDVLQEASVLDDEARKRIDEAGREARRKRFYSFYEVDDLSRWHD